jgi:hypothetical protein
LRTKPVRGYICGRNENITTKARLSSLWYSRKMN